MSASMTKSAPQALAASDAKTTSQDATANGLWSALGAHVHLLGQILALLQDLRAAAPEGFVFGQKLGPHLRHVLEHYKAFLDAVKSVGSGGDGCVDYDARARNRLVESDADAARTLIYITQRELLRGRKSFPADLATPMLTRLMSGAAGETVVTVPTSLGRELLFLESHTVHHMALLADYVRGLGVALEANFGKAPATIAFERNQLRLEH